MGKCVGAAGIRPTVLVINVLARIGPPAVRTVPAIFETGTMGRTLRGIMGNILAGSMGLVMSGIMGRIMIGIGT